MWKVFHYYFSGNFSFMEKFSVKYAGAAAMYFVSKKLKKKYNITDERAALYEAAETWVDALNGRDFLGMYSTVVFAGARVFIHIHFSRIERIEDDKVFFLNDCIILFYGVAAVCNTFYTH